MADYYQALVGCQVIIEDRSDLVKVDRETTDYRHLLEGKVVAVEKKGSSLAVTIKGKLSGQATVDLHGICLENNNLFLVVIVPTEQPVCGVTRVPMGLYLAAQHAQVVR